MIDSFCENRNEDIINLKHFGMKHCLTTTTLLAVSTARAFVVAPLKKATTSSLTTAFMSSSSSNDAFYSLTATAGDGSKVSMSDFKVGYVLHA